ncbi:Hypothetical predicted protein [Cloeon dipterum]|uniref:Uncharacterized protein n=1 Tax=Cloeon dipterum TaxID=197152 RepID=A0A8S1E4Q5_9INSE|nr:Hypothetical predicted protein [Cloeon dipterum]
MHGKEIINFLVGTLGLKVDEKDKNGEEPIHYAIRAKNISFAQELLKRRHPKGAEESKNNLLHFCVMDNKLELAKIMLEEDRNLLNEPGELGLKTIHLAAWNSDLEMFKWLVDEVVDVYELCSNYKASALHYAAYNKSHGKKLIRYLISDLGFDVHAKAENGLTPLHYALYNENVNNATLLLNLGADIEVREDDSDNSDDLLSYCARSKKSESVKFLLKHHPEFIKEIDANGFSAFQFIVQFADWELVKWILDEFKTEIAGVAEGLHFATYNISHGKELVRHFVSEMNLDVNAAEENRGWTPLHYAFFAENVEIAEELVKLGADLEVELHSNNLLHFCVVMNKLKSAKYLLVNKLLPINEPNKNGKTAVHLAAEHASVEMLKLLTKG